MPVHKGDNQWRMTIDYRAVNAKTVPKNGLMPYLPTRTSKVNGKSIFMKGDFIKGFWQLPLHENSQEILSFQTDEGVYTPTRVPQGTVDSALHFQGIMNCVFAPLLYEKVLLWIDDLLMFVDTLDDYFTTLRAIFDILDAHNLKLHAKKTQLFLREVKWCGKVYNGDGVAHDPERRAGVTSLRPPSNVGELQQFICAVNWMRESLPDYARVVAPLQECLQRNLAGTRRTKRVANRISLELTAEELACFESVKQLLRTDVVMAHDDDASTVCLFTDASDYGRSVVITITKVPDWDADVISPADQLHQPMLFLSGSFKGAELNWTERSVPDHCGDGAC